jgi:hypothetical protein
MSDGTVDNLFSALVGKQIPGGCGECDAYQTMRQEQPGVWMLVVHHDDDCPSYRARVGRTGVN